MDCPPNHCTPPKRESVAEQSNIADDWGRELKGLNGLSFILLANLGTIVGLLLASLPHRRLYNLRPRQLQIHHHLFYGPAQCSLKLWPAHSPSRLTTLYTDSSDSFVGSAVFSIVIRGTNQFPGGLCTR
jgi:hypothetical protein